MLLLYTGAIQPLTGQRNPEKSLGGFVSSTKIPNGRINNLFEDVSYYTKIDKPVQYKAVAIENNTGDALINLKFGINYLQPNPNYKLELAIVSMNAPYVEMEKLEKTIDEPYYAQFVECIYDVANNIDNRIGVPDLLPNVRYGVWIKKTILNPQQNSNLTDCDIYSEGIVKPVDTKFEFIMTFGDDGGAPIIGEFNNDNSGDFTI